MKIKRLLLFISFLASLHVTSAEAVRLKWLVQETGLLARQVHRTIMAPHFVQSFSIRPFSSVQGQDAFQKPEFAIPTYDSTFKHFLSDAETIPIVNESWL
jgi:hypothetical protein